MATKSRHPFSLQNEYTAAWKQEDHIRLNRDEIRRAQSVNARWITRDRMSNYVKLWRKAERPRFNETFGDYPTGKGDTVQIASFSDFPSVGMGRCVEVPW